MENFNKYNKKTIVNNTCEKLKGFIYLLVVILTNYF